MLNKEIIEIRRIWDETKARHLDYFTSANLFCLFKLCFRFTHDMG